MAEAVQDAFNQLFERGVRDMRREIREEINASGDFTPYQEALFASAIETAAAQEIELLRNYIRSMDDAGLRTAGRIVNLIQLSVWNEILGRKIEQRAVQDIAEKQEEEKNKTKE